MSGKSRKSSRKNPKGLTTTKSAIDRPFDSDVWRRANELAADYRLILEETDDLGFIGSSLELPGVLADGPTADRCVKELRQALAAAVATMLEMGQRPPQPAARQTRLEQINIRVTPEEKLRLAEAARSRGFRGISDYVRTAALNSGS